MRGPSKTARQAAAAALPGRTLTDDAADFFRWVLDSSQNGRRDTQVLMSPYQFQARSSSSYSFEDFLRDAERTGIADPGDAMITVLRRTRVPGLSPEQIVRSSSLNPCGRPGKLITFLRHVCVEGQWGGDDLNSRVD